MTNQSLTLDYALTILRKYKKDFANKYGITDIGIFGSVARGQIKPESDVDVIIRMKKPDLFFMVHIKETLEEEYKTKVDIIHYRDKMNSFLKQRIDRDAIYV